MGKLRSETPSGKPVINLAALRDPDEPRDHLRDIIWSARVRAVCEQQGIDVVDCELTPNERAVLERDTQRIARERSSPEGWWRAKERIRWRRECLEWCRQHRPGHRPEGLPNDPYDLPLHRAGAPGMLMASDLSAEDGRKALLARWANLRYEPTLEQLQQAKAVCHAIDRIFAGGTVESWAYVAKMHEAVFTQAIARVSAIEAIEHGIHLFRCVREVDNWQREHGVDDLRDGDAVRHDHAERTLRSLKGIDERFGAIAPKTLFVELRDAAELDEAEVKAGGRGKKGAVAIVAELALACGAFGEMQGPEEDYSIAVKRAKNSFSNARERVEKLTKGTAE